jgi:DNA primase
MRAIPIFLTEQVEAKICTLPANHDPDTFLQKYGPEVLDLELKKAISLPEFLFNQLADQYGLDLEGKAKIAAELHTLAKEIGDNQLQKTVFISHFSQKLGIPIDQLDKATPAEPRPTDIPAVTERQNDPKHLPLKQKQLLEFLIIFPEYLQKFMEAGIKEVIVSRVGQNILKHLEEFVLEGDGSLDQLLDLAEGPEKSFISRLLINSPSYSDEDREKIAAEKTAWLGKNRRQGLRENLTGQIKKAQQSGDVELCLKLIAQKTDLDRQTD